MPNVDDHGLEVLKKAAVNLDPVSKRNYALQVVPAGLLNAPFDADGGSSTLVGLVRTIIYTKAAVPVKTVTITYADCSYETFTWAVT